MDLEHLKALGFSLDGGQVDYKNRNYGFFTKHGAVLTEEGEELVAQLEEESGLGVKPAAEPKKPAAKKAAKKSDAVLVESDPETVGNLLDSLHEALN